jgi:hypothetical protein
MKEKKCLSFWELHYRVEQLCGGVLLGYQHPEAGLVGSILTRAVSSMPKINPPNKHTPINWEKGDILLVMRREYGYDETDGQASASELCCEEFREAKKVGIQQMAVRDQLTLPGEPPDC